MAKYQPTNRDQLLARIEKNLSIKRGSISDSRLQKLSEDGQQLILYYGADPVIAPATLKLVETLAAKKLPEHIAKSSEAASTFIMMASSMPMSPELEEGLAKLLPPIFKDFAEADVAKSRAGGVSRFHAYKEVIDMLEATSESAAPEGPFKKTVAELSLHLKRKAMGLSL